MRIQFLTSEKPGTHHTSNKVKTMPNPNTVRRKFLALLALTAGSGFLRRAFGNTLSQDSTYTEQITEPRIGIALGSGGAKGLAHILMLEVFDELGIKPHLIVGSSMGAVIGSLYASGLTGKDIRKVIDELVISKNDRLGTVLFRKDLLKWINFLDPNIGSGGLIDGESFIQHLHQSVRSTRFEELVIPLKVVATDFWRREQVVLESGDLLPAIKASMAVPGLFAPVRLNSKVLVDGGTVNPIPYDLLWPECDISIAVDVMGTMSTNTQEIPSFFDAIFGGVHILQQSILIQMMRTRPPDVYVKPDIMDVRMLEFYKADAIYRQAQGAKDKLKKELERLLA